MSQMPDPCRCQRVSSYHRGRRVGSIEETIESRDLGARVANGVERVWKMLPPALYDQGRLVAFVFSSYRHDRRSISGSRTFDVKLSDVSWKERLANRGVVDQENQIGRIAPKVSERRRFRLMIKLLPRGSAIALTGWRIDCLKICTNRLANCVMHHKTVARGLNERQAGQPIEYQVILN